MINTQAQCKLLHTCFISVIVKQHLVQMGRIDGPAEYLSQKVAAIRSPLMPRPDPNRAMSTSFRVFISCNEYTWSLFPGNFGHPRIFLLVHAKIPDDPRGPSTVLVDCNPCRLRARILETKRSPTCRVVPLFLDRNPFCPDPRPKTWNLELSAPEPNPPL